MKKLKVLNVKGRTSEETIDVQAAMDTRHLYLKIKKYFEEELLNNSNVLNDPKNLQDVLGRRANNIACLSEYSFDDDQRVVELAVLIAIYETTRLIGGHSKQSIVRPAWQLPRQADAMERYTGKKSWDGFFLPIPPDTATATALIPFELKSLMDNPENLGPGSPNQQIKNRIIEFKKHFQMPGSINALLVMPYTDENELKFDLAYAADELRKVVSAEAQGFVCMLSFSYDEKSNPMMSLLCALVSQDAASMNITNIDHWMREINFGKLC